MGGLSFNRKQYCKQKCWESVVFHFISSHSKQPALICFSLFNHDRDLSLILTKHIVVAVASYWGNIQFKKQHPKYKYIFYQCKISAYGHSLQERERGLIGVVVSCRTFPEEEVCWYTCQTAQKTCDELFLLICLLPAVSKETLLGSQAAPPRRRRNTKHTHTNQLQQQKQLQQEKHTLLCDGVLHTEIMNNNS